MLISTRASGLRALLFLAELMDSLVRRGSRSCYCCVGCHSPSLDPNLDFLPTDLAERLQVGTGSKRAVLEVTLAFLVPVLPLQLQLCQRLGVARLRRKTR